MNQKLVDALWKLQLDPGGTPNAEVIKQNISAEEGQWIQLEILERWLNDGKTLGGWKIGMTSGESRDALGPGVRPFGFLLKERLLNNRARIIRDQLYRGGVENELCFFVGPSEGSDETAGGLPNIAGCAAGFEINQKRLPPGCSAGVRVGDNLSNWGVVAGHAVEVPKNLEDLSVTLFKTEPEGRGKELEIGRVKSSDHIDDHFDSLRVLAKRLEAFGHRLQEGQWVITGAYEKHPFEVAHFRGHFDLEFGDVEVSLTSTQQ